MGNKAADKNIVLCSDGTGNSDTKGRGTNVIKLYEAVDKRSFRSIPDVPQQIAFYDDEVGAENFALNRMIGAAFGYGFAAIVRDLHNALAHVYNSSATDSRCWLTKGWSIAIRTAGIGSDRDSKQNFGSAERRVFADRNCGNRRQPALAVFSVCADLVDPWFSVTKWRAASISGRSSNCRKEGQQ